jgi:nickel/cobalt exporter
MRLLPAVVGTACLLSGVVHAHPMGAFSVNRWTSLTFRAGGVSVVHVLDLAEIPTQMELSALEGVPDDERLEPLKTSLAPRIRRGLFLEAGGRAVPLTLLDASLVLLPGAGGLPTARLTLHLAGDLAGGETDVVFRDKNFEGRLGWKEVIARAEGAAELLSTDVPSEDRSHGLTEYPADPLAAPPDAIEARLRVKASPLRAQAGERAPERRPERKPSVAVGESARQEDVSVPAPAMVRAVVAPTPAAAKREDALTKLIHAPVVGARTAALALLIAFGLGALHALSPGHGKTIVAAYLVGSRGTALHALLLGVVVTASHTAGVFVLGLVTLSLSRSVVPERLYPGIELVSGLSIAAVGIAMLVRRLRRPAADHEHGPLGHSHAETLPPGTTTLPALLVLGASGGVLPCPSALVVLLSAIALGRVAFGLALIVSFSLGLAAVLSGIGVFVVRAGRVLARSEAFGAWAMRLPIVSALLVSALGIAIFAKALRDAGLLFVRT